jgi:general secretion pathway protein G
MKARQNGFTLVELLMVFMIIAVLAGMMMLATGMSRDGAEAAKIISDLRNLKSAAILYYADQSRWPTNADVPDLDKYADRPIYAAVPPRYSYVMIGTAYFDSAGRARVNMGVGLFTSGNGSLGIQKKLAAKAQDAGILGNLSDFAAPYTGGADVFINMK